ncbi:MAG: DNA polymerase subunit beta [Archaeoglobales archaeon]|nr:MAG: DNA polymerase subunit beta [Archaeoglobales archaeon]
MPPNLIELQKKVAETELEYYRNLEKNLKYIKKRATEILKDARVYVFGSVVEGEYIPGKSDIDVLIVSNEIPKTVSGHVKLKLKILGELGYLSPFEIHFADEKLFEHYSRFATLVEVD